jgi:hypothetical protein
MNNGQAFNTFDTRNFLGNAPGKTHKGKTSQGDFFLLSSRKNSEFTAARLSALNTATYLTKSAQNTSICVPTQAVSISVQLYGPVQQKYNRFTLDFCAQT